MAMIFPGMDPYLESPQLWPGIHAALIVYIRDQLQPVLRPRYLAVIEERVYLERPDRDIVPDLRVHHHRPNAARPALSATVAESDAPVLVHTPPRDVHETFVAILDRQSGERVVTVIEVVSPTNKYAGPGRVSYVAKQDEILRGPMHLVEIDLLRAGPHVLAVPEYAARRAAEYDYLVCVNRSQEQRDTFELYPRRLRERLPRLRVPLAGTDPDVVLTSRPPSAWFTTRAATPTASTTTGPASRPCADDQAWADQLVAQAPPGGA